MTNLIHSVDCFTVRHTSVNNSAFMTFCSSWHHLLVIPFLSSKPWAQPNYRTRRRSPFYSVYENSFHSDEHLSVLSVEKAWFVCIQLVFADLVDEHSQHDDAQASEYPRCHRDAHHCLVLLQILGHYTNTGTPNWPIKKITQLTKGLRDL